MGVCSSSIFLGGSGKGCPMLKSLGSEDVFELGSPGVRVSGEESEGPEVCATVGV